MGGFLYQSFEGIHQGHLTLFFPRMVKIHLAMMERTLAIHTRDVFQLPDHFLPLRERGNWRTPVSDPVATDANYIAFGYFLQNTIPRMSPGSGLDIELFSKGVPMVKIHNVKGVFFSAVSTGHAFHLIQ